VSQCALFRADRIEMMLCTGTSNCRPIGAGSALGYEALVPAAGRIYPHNYRQALPRPGTRFSLRLAQRTFTGFRDSLAGAQKAETCPQIRKESTYANDL
jgi:hypothetical protein